MLLAMYMHSSQCVTSRPSKEIINYLYRGRSAEVRNRLIGEFIDTSKPEWNNGVTNIYMIDAVGSRWTRVHGGWYFLGYDNTDVEAIALNDEGYLLADTVTPDGYYVNKRGVLEMCQAFVSLVTVTQIGI